MFWGIDQQDWMQLWSGAIGSFVAAIIGGLVAWMVVKLTHSRQKQLVEAQRRDAADDRERRIIGELLVAAHDMLDALWEGADALEKVRQRMSATINVWKIDQGPPGLLAVLPGWPHWILNAATLSLESPSQDERIKAHGTFRERVRIFAGALESWPSATETQRAGIISDLTREPGGLLIYPADPKPRDP